MSLYKSVEPFTEASEIRDFDVNADAMEMSVCERAFLCGLIRDNRPKRILEIGVASGATTAVILNAIKLLGLSTELISVDICERFYKDTTKSTGYLAESWKNENGGGNHICFYGKVIAECIDDIAKDGLIDFVVLDTSHQVPGEILDFITVLPYLKKNAVVVLHDVMMLLEFPRHDATRILFNSVSGEKYYFFLKNELPNIGAFGLTEDTFRNVADVYSALIQPWVYFPSKYHLQKYRECIEKKYGNKLNDYFQLILTMQEKYAPNNRIRNQIGDNLGGLISWWKKQTKVYIYGAGQVGNMYARFAYNNGLPVSAMVVSDGQSIEDNQAQELGFSINYYSEIRNEIKEAGVIVAIDGDLRIEIMNILKSEGAKNIWSVL